MIDERLGRTAGAWLRDTDELAPDPPGIVMTAMARVPQVRQVHASGIRARLERETVPVPGILHPATDHHGRTGGSSMSASLRFVMAAFVLLVSGGLLFAAVWPPSTDEAVAPVPAMSSASPQPTPSSESSALTTTDTTSDGEFELTISSPKSTWTVDESIDIGAALTYVGTEDQRVVTTAHGGAVAFRIVQLDGPFATEVVRRSSCESHTYAQGEIETIPFARSGSFGAQSDDADFWRAWFGDPELRLTPGTYRIVAEARYGPQGCADTSTLEAAVTMEVVAAADATPEASASPSDAEPSVQQWTSTGIKTRPTSRRS